MNIQTGAILKDSLKYLSVLSWKYFLDHKIHEYILFLNKKIHFKSRNLESGSILSLSANDIWMVIFACPIEHSMNLHTFLFAFA